MSEAASAGNWIAGTRRALAAHRYLAASCLVHALLLAVLAGGRAPGALPDVLRARAAAAAEARTARQLARTEERALRYRVERMEAIWHALAEAARGAPGAETVPTLPDEGDSSPRALAARAQALADAIEAVQRRLRAAALARLAGLSPAEALREVDARAAANPPPRPPGTPAETIARLEGRAQDALEAHRAQVEAQQQGVRVRYPADGIPRALSAQLAEMVRNGPAQGRVGEPGFEGGRSVNPKWVEGVAGGRIGRPEDTAPGGTRVDLGAPVSQRGGRLDLTAAGSAGRVPLPRPPGVDLATLHTGAGRVLGPGGAYADRVYLDSWYLLGPFAAHGAQPLAAVYPPEEGIDLDGTYRGAGGRALTWQYASRGFYPFVPPGAEARAIYYAYTELRVDEARDVWLAIAADDDSMLWLDGRLVWVGPGGDKPWYRPPYYLPDEQVASLALAEGQRRVHLGPGAHRVLLKLFNERDRAFFSVVLSP